ncbi:DNA polymerase I [Chthonomonas calidirosea]|uniref:DNA polymerase I n=1 Tax=Chthonomonas calidirosea TaxID=454171 RepID=UPI0006EC6960|nr:DNA polymerase I [Chthonomonas calidirosea]CEK12558.1 DNA polymerase I [Chthonomonas calidirosea]
MESENGVKRKLILIDGYSLLFRAFFAGQALTTSDKRPTGALYGLANMLLSVLQSDKPDAIMVCWDAHAPTFREQEFIDYKAHRPSAAPELKEQMPVARQLVSAFGIPCVELAGYEADDIIGTLAHKGKAEGYQVIVITGDSDQLQLVDDHRVIVEITQRGVSERKAYDRQAVYDRYEVWPEQIPDFKALTGDASDNIPGVPGIGEKTAAKLLQQFGTLENLLEHLDEVTPPRIQQALKEGKEQALFSKRLATIVCDVPLDVEIVPYSPSEADWQRVRAIFRDLEFRSLLARIPQPSSPLAAREEEAPEERFDVAYRPIRDAAALKHALEVVKTKGRVAIRLELEGDAPLDAKLRGVAFAVKETEGENGGFKPSSYYVAIQEPEAIGGLWSFGEGGASDQEGGYVASLQELEPLFNASGIRRLAYQAKQALIVLQRHGVRPLPFDFDVQIAAYLLDAGRSTYPLMDIAETYLRRRLELEDAFAPAERLMVEAGAILALEQPLERQLETNGMTKVFYEIEMPLVPVLAAIEQHGLLVDVDYLSVLSQKMAEQIAKIAAEIYELAGMEFNIGSPKQLQEVLFNKLQLPRGKKTKTGYSTGADLLEQLAPRYEIARKILEYREMAKLKATYADALVRLVRPDTHRVHTSLNQTITSTGRLSSSDPNLQNIPIRSEVGRQIRRAFIAPNGYKLLSCDYSQIELRVLAHVSDDPTLIQAFLNDEDIHAATAATVFGVEVAQVTPEQRRLAKTINFAVIYGQSAFSLAATLGVETGVAHEWIQAYFARLPGVKRYIEEIKELAHRQGWVQTLFGRRRYLPDLRSGNHQVRQAAERAAINMPIQGTAADIMKLAMIRVYHRLNAREDCALLLQVHDELLFEVKEEKIEACVAEIVPLMQEAYPLKVPLKVDAKVGTDWANMENVTSPLPKR